MTASAPMVWADVETTGLDPEYAQLLEIGVIITGDDLEPHAAFHRVVHWTEFYGLGDIVFKMHTDNGLFEDCRHSGYTLSRIDTELRQFFRQQGIDGTSPLCGSTVGFDRAFIKRDLPLAYSLLHYRSIDVSTLKELVKRWAPDRLWQKHDFHRSMPDIHESIKELRHYRTALGL